MARGAPLRVTVEVRLLDGARGRRCFRLSSHISSHTELPPTLVFEGDLPIQGQAAGSVAFQLPDSGRVRTEALLRFDPEHPGQGSTAELQNLPPDILRALETYINHMTH